MKKFLLSLGILMAGTISFGQVLTENFSYTAGQAITANGWTAYSGAGTNPILVTSPGLTYTGHPGSGVGNAVTMTTSGEDDNRGFTAITSGTVYVSFLINFSAVQTGDYCIGLFQTSSIFPLRIYARTDGSGGFNFGISKGASTVSYEATSRILGTTYFVVASYTYNTGTTTDDVLNLWVNPVLGGSEPPATIPNVTGTSGDATSIAAVFLRQGGAASASTQQVDAILAGTTWADVAPASAGSPTLTPNPSTVPDFGNIIIGTNSTSQSFDLSGTNLTGAPGNITITAPSTNFEVSNDNSTWGANTTIPYTSATLTSTPVYVRFTPQSVGVLSGNINITGGGAATNVPVSGTGLAIPPPVATAATGITSTSFTANWNAVSGATGYFLDVYELVSTPINDTLAGWNFAVNTAANQIADVGNANNIGIQMVNPVATTGTVSWPAGPSGAAGTPNPFSVSTTGWDNGADTKYWQIDLNTTGATNLSLSSMQGSSNTGPANFKIQYKIGAGGTWTDIAGGTITLTTAVVAGNLATWGIVSDLPIPSAADNQPLVSIRWIQTSNVSVNLGTVAAGGTSRISAIYIKYSTVAMLPVYVPGYQDLSVGNVLSHIVTGLTSNTTYYYVIRAANSAGVSANSNEISVITTVPPPPVLTAGTLADFGNVTVGTNSASQSFNLSGSNLTGFPGNITITAPSTDFEVSNDNSTWGPSTTIAFTSATLPSTPVYARFTPQSVGVLSGNININGGGASTTVAVSGTGTAVPIPSLVATPISNFGTVIVGSNSTSQTSNLSGTDLTGAPGNITITAPSADFEVSNDNSTWGPNTTIPYASSTLTSTPVYIRFIPQSAGVHSGNVTVTGGGASTTIAVSGTGVIPTLTTTALTAFGNVCTNTTAGPNSFTINGNNLSSANVTVAAVAGYTYSTTAGGTYTTTLSLTQPGGTYSQQIFVRFSPTAVQSYNGNIVVGGGGAASVNVAASGSGVNTAPSVTTGAASSITFNSATAAGTITATGCTAITAYGIEYSTTNGFPNGTGIQVASGNLSGGNFSSNLTGLTSSTTYYYKAYATNNGGTTYGVQQSFTTPAPPAVLSATTLSVFGNVCINTTAGPNSFTLTGNNLNTTNINVGPLAGYTFATSAGGTYSASLSLTQPGGVYSQQVFVNFSPTAVQSYNGNIPVSGGGAAAINVAASGSGVNTLTTVTTGSSSNITTQSATLAGTIDATGCSNVTTYGIEYSGINGFANGTGTQVTSNNISGNNFSVSLTGLVQGATYYYKAYATNSGGTAYGAQQSFTVLSIPNEFKLYPVPAERGTMVRITMNNLNPGNYSLVFINSGGQLAYQKNIHLQAGFINQEILIPATIGPGVYVVQIIYNTSVLGAKNILVF